MKCYGDFICSNCNKLIHKDFDVPDDADIEQANIDCPYCGKNLNITTTVPTLLKNSVQMLMDKGYPVIYVNEETLCIVIKDHYLKEITVMPDEFMLDMMEKDADVIYNARMKADDFEEIDKELYTNVSAGKLEDWIDGLPEVAELEDKE